MAGDLDVQHAEAAALEGFGLVYKSMHGSKFEQFDAEATLRLLRQRVQEASVQSDDSGRLGALAQCNAEQHAHEQPAGNMDMRHIVLTKELQPPHAVDFNNIILLLHAFLWSAAAAAGGAAAARPCPCATLVLPINFSSS